MSERVVFRVTVRSLLMSGAVGLLLVLLALSARPLWAQKVQESYRDKFNIAEETGGVAIATSSDGKYVYVAGSASLPLLRDDSHRGRRGASRPTPRRHERDPCHYSDTLLGCSGPADRPHGAPSGPA